MACAWVVFGWLFLCAVCAIVHVHVRLAHRDTDTATCSVTYNMLSITTCKKRDAPSDVEFPRRKRPFAWYTEQSMLRGCETNFGTEITGGEITTFACHSELDELVVRSCPIHSIPILSQLPALTRLDLSHSKMGVKEAEVGTKYVADLFAHLPCLSSLNLQWNDIGETVVKAWPLRYNRIAVNASTAWT